MMLTRRKFDIDRSVDSCTRAEDFLPTTFRPFLRIFLHFNMTSWQGTDLFSSYSYIYDYVAFCKVDKLERCRIDGMAEMNNAICMVLSFMC